MMTARRLTPILVLVAALAAFAAVLPFALTDGPGPSTHVSVRGEAVVLYGYGPYRHMPADVAIQGLAQDAVTLFLAVPLLITTLVWAGRGSKAGYLALSGVTAYLFVQYFLYLAMATYNQLFLVWTALVLLSSQALIRLLVARPHHTFVVADLPRWRRWVVGAFLIVSGATIGLLWLSVVVPPLLSGTLYPPGLAHLTTMVVQGFDLALFLPVSFIAGYRYLRERPVGDLLAPVCCVFLVLQMTALLAKVVWMSAVGVSAGPALIVIPMLLLGASAAAWLSLSANFVSFEKEAIGNSGSHVDGAAA